MKDLETFTGNMLSSILNGMDALITVCDHETFDLIFLNDAIRKRFNVSDSYVGQKCYRVLQKREEPCENCPYNKINLEKAISWEHRESVLGSILYKNAKLIPWFGGRVAHLEYAIDITAFRQEQEQNVRLRDEIYYDALTGARNRRYFDEKIGDLLRLSGQEGDSVGMMMIDIDLFKQYNDELGHPKGDECLRAVAGIIQSSLARRTDFVARYGGEEFVVVLPNITDDGLRLVADKIHKNILLARLERPDGIVTVSIGATIGSDLDKTGLLEMADEALYESKRNGRNRVTFKRKCQM